MSHCPDPAAQQREKPADIAQPVTADERTEGDPQGDRDAPHAAPPHEIAPNRGGRPRVLTPELLARARELLVAGRTRAHVARKLQISRRTLDRYLARPKPTG